MLISLHERDPIEAALMRNPELNIYGLGDLDPFFWPRSVWYASPEPSQPPGVVALLYIGVAPPSLLLFEADDEAQRLISELLPFLPQNFQAHLHPDLVPLLRQRFDFVSNGMHWKMALRDPERLTAADDSEAIRLNSANLPQIHELYRRSYPQNWFDPRMLESGQYVGIRRDDVLAAIAGIHVFSPEYRVAALGNITTDPRYRRQGLGRAVTAACCRSLLRQVDRIGLNVKQDNRAAIACYESLGFERVCQYLEGAFQSGQTGAT